MLKKADPRELKFEYKHTPAKVTTEQANKMGIKEVIGEFTTGGFVAASGTNIRVVAEKVNGAIVKPKETFSLNKYTGPRGTAQGYVEAGIIENGIPGKAVGGGISQFATTLYNAYYYAGMKDAGHKEHSYWITRYPKGREATVFMDGNGNSLIDIAFTNPDDTGVAIQTIWSPGVDQDRSVGHQELRRHRLHQWRVQPHPAAGEEGQQGRVRAEQRLPGLLGDGHPHDQGPPLRPVPQRVAHGPLRPAVQDRLRAATRRLIPASRSTVATSG